MSPRQLPRSKDTSAAAASEPPLTYQDASTPEAPPLSFRHMFLRSSALERLATGDVPWGWARHAKQALGFCSGVTKVLECISLRHTAGGASAQVALWEAACCAGWQQSQS